MRKTSRAKTQSEAYAKRTAIHHKSAQVLDFADL